MPSTITPQQFVHKWSNVELKESAASQQHFLDLCRLVGHPTPAQVDHKGEFFTFEAGASKQTGGQGWADVWKKGFFGWEYKGKHANLDKAYQQLLQYRESLQNPPLLVVSDMQRIFIHTNFTNTVKRTYELDLEDLLIPDRLDILRAVFNEPERLRAPETTEQVTKQAAREFARLADILRKDWGEDPQQTAHYLIRLLFCLFAEDIGLLPRGLFTRLIQQTSGTVTEYTDRIRGLFAAMSTGGWFGVERIAFFDGGLFDDDFALELPGDGMRILINAARLDWSSIEPSILGTLFERSLDPKKRSQLGTHYTSKEDILLIVEPVLMEPLRRRWADVRRQAEGLAREGKTEEVFELLDGFAQEIAAVRVLDPAGGSGNFLYVSLRQLLDLEKEVITLCRDLGAGEMLPRVSPAQLHGIEIDPYAHELAEATVWIGYIQWLHENGFGRPEEPILKPLDTILQMDAILAYDEEGNPIEPEWPEAEVIIGNPPFLGGNKIRQELGDEYVNSLFALYSNRVPAFADIVCYWFERARAYVAAGKSERAGLLATQAIRGGANRVVLERIKESGDIFWAWSDRNWILDGATVHVSMIGFDDGSENVRRLDGEPVTEINPDLTSHVDLTTAKQLNENAGICFMGASPKGSFDITKKQADRFLESPLNIDGRPNSDVIRPIATASDLMRNSLTRWTIDFALMSLEEAANYERPFEHVKEHVYPVRRKNRRKSYRERWWQYAEARPGMREALDGLERFIATPAVSKHRVFVWVKSHVLCRQSTLVFARDEDYFFGVLQSSLHELWARSQGTQLRDAESGSRYTPTTTFETFPFPWPPGQEPQDDPRVKAIAEAARELVEQRDAWLNPADATNKELKKRTLTNLYNDYPTWLELAHKKLDRAVLDAYGWPHDISDEEILERLLELNLERADQAE